MHIISVAPFFENFFKDNMIVDSYLVLVQLCSAEHITFISIVWFW